MLVDDFLSLHDLISIISSIVLLFLTIVIVIYTIKIRNIAKADVIIEQMKGIYIEFESNEDHYYDCILRLVLYNCGSGSAKFKRFLLYLNNKNYSPEYIAFILIGTQQLHAASYNIDYLPSIGPEQRILLELPYRLKNIMFEKFFSVPKKHTRILFIGKINNNIRLKIKANICFYEEKDINKFRKEHPFEYPLVDT